MTPVPPFALPAAPLFADGIAQAMLQLGPAGAASLAAQPPWVQAALDPRRRVVFLDTALVEGARETGGAGCTSEL